MVMFLRKLLLLLFILKINAKESENNTKCVVEKSENCFRKEQKFTSSVYNRSTDNSSKAEWNLRTHHVQDNHNLSFELKNNLSDVQNYFLTLEDLMPNGDYFLLDENDIGIGSNEEDFITNINKKILEISPPFNPAYSDRVSARCKEQSKVYMDALRRSKMWALRMHDSSAKLTTGILNGNVNQLGDFDNCIKVQVDKSMRGQYCLAGMRPTVPPNTKLLQHFFNMVQSNGLLKSQLDDPGHRVPRFSTINWALCVPSGCSPRDIEVSLDEFLQNKMQGTGIQLQVRVEPELCQKKDDIWNKNYDKSTRTVWSLFGAFLFITFLSTLYDYKVEENKNQWLTIFSLIKNTKEILSLEEDPNDVKCLHGIRFINAMLLVIAHKTMAELFTPFTNRTDMSELLGQPWTVVGRAAAIFTDPFIMFSAFLTSYSIFGRLQRGQKIKFYQEYIGRILRIAPPLGTLILFCSFILPYMGSGPQWNLVVTNHGDICKKYWWRNMMFIHNYFGFKDMCLTHTHHIGIDTQLFFVSPIFILTLWKWPKRGTALIIAVVTITTIHRFYTTYKLRLANYVYFGTTVQQLFDTADYMYILPYYRTTVYLMGILLGYACRVYRDVRLTQKQLKVGWYVSSILFLLAFFGPANMGSINYKYNPMHAANYAAFSPIAWCIFFGWAVYTSHIGYTNKLTDFLSWKGFRITTRLSYAIYLTQFPVFFYNVGKIRTAHYFNFLTGIVFNTNEYIVIFMVSYILTVFCETPFSNIKKLMFRNSKISNKISSNICDFNKNSKTISYPSEKVKDLND